MKNPTALNLSPGSALLLAVMVISILTTTTLGAIAIRFDQLGSTDKITSAAKAKLAADSGLAALRQKITTDTSFPPEVYDLTANAKVNVTGSIDQFRANPRRSVYSVESQVINLPRCLAVAVLSPWVNTGTYLLDQDDSDSNPAKIFYYANIINDTPLGVIATNTGNQGGYNATEKALPISEITKMGQFYNPYAPKGELESSRNYWTVKLGGPNDEFLYKTDPTGAGSFYKGLDFVYIPYLPRFTDSGVLQVAGSAASGLTRKSGTAIRADFEQVIKKNNLKVWLDGSATNDWLFQFGLSDLFTDSAENRVTWIQPTLWNDLPEADGEPGFATGLAGPYLASNPGATMADAKTSWTKQTLPTKDVTATDGAWQAQIIRGSKSFSFLYPSSPTNRTLEKKGTITLSHYGSLEGLRLNQDISVVLLDINNRPLKLKKRDNTSQGTFYNTRITNITQETSGSVSVELTFSDSDTNTPVKDNGNPVVLSDLSVISLQAGPQLATKQSVGELTLQTDDKTVKLDKPSKCPNVSISSFVVCPAVADIVSLSKNGSKPVWGRVTSVDYSASGKDLNGFTLDKFREYPRPLRDMASTVFSEVVGVTTVEKIAYYGGSIDANEFDGGLNTISDELWFYTPASNAWEYLPNAVATGSSAPGARSGASLAFVNSSLYLFGGYTYDGAGQLAAGQPCLDNYHINNCLVFNRAGARVAKYMPSSMFRFDLAAGANQRKWTKVSYEASNNATPIIAPNTQLELRVVSRLGERSGKELWQPRVVVGTASVNINPANETTLSANSAGFGKGDQIYLSGTNGSASFITWARVTEVGTNTIKIRSYGIKAPASGSTAISLTNVTLYGLSRIKSSTTCTWAATGTCTAADTTGLAIGDAITLEQYDNYANPQSLTGSYAGHIGQISGNQVSFISDEKVTGIDDYKPNPIYDSKESVRNLPLGRIGANFFTNPGSNKIFLWQGDQVTTNTAARATETWEFDTSNNKWSLVPLTLDNLPDKLTIQSLRLPATAYVYTSANKTNPAITKGKKNTDKSGGGDTTYYTWDDSQSWTLELAEEFSSNLHLTEGSTIVIERVSGAERERFTGVISKINVDNSAKKFTVKHNPGSGGDSGLKDNSDNAKITLYYPDYRNTNALTTICSNNQVCAEATKTSNDSVRVDNADNAAVLRKLPIGTTVLLYGGSLSGTNSQMFTGTIDNRVVTGTNEVTISAAGPRFISSPVPQAYTAGALAGSGSDDRLAIGWQNYRAKTGLEPGAVEWVNNLTGGTHPKKWVVRYSGSYSLNSGDNRPSPRQGGAVAASIDGHSIFMAGGTIGTYSNFWKLNEAHLFNNSKWIFGKSDFDGANDIPNLSGSSLNVLSSGNAVLFNGRREADNSSIGPRVLTQAVDSVNYDGTFTLAGQADNILNSLKAGQFINTLSGSYASGIGAKSLQLTDKSESTAAKMCRFVGQENCDYQMMRYLGTLGRYPLFSGGSSLAVINPGSSFKKEGDNRSLLLSGPAQSLTKTNDRWDQEGYYPYRCDVADKAGCNITLPFGTLDGGSEANNTKTLMLAGFSRINGGGSILVTPAGIGKAIVSGAGGASYCAKEASSVDDSGKYSCNTSKPRSMRWIPDSEDVVFMLNAAKALSATDSYRIVGYYGGVLRGYLAVSVGSDLKIQEIAP